MSQPTEPPLRQRVVAAAGAACVSVMLVNPLDVVKARTRQQAAATLDMARVVQSGDRPLAGPVSTQHTAGATVAVRGGDGSAGGAAVPQVAAAREAQRRSAWGVARQMVAREGWSSLWRGTGASLLVAAPTVGVYYPLYDVLSSSFNAVGVPTALAPALAGGLARSAVVISLAPLELVRTRIQAARPGEPDATLGIAAGLALAFQEGTPAASTSPRPGFLSRAAFLWRGTAATLARDVPFSALYWAGLEPFRSALMAASGGGSDGTTAIDPWTVTRVNLLSGSASGAVAAALTTPFDVVKTRLQVAHDSAAASGMTSGTQPARSTVASLRTAAAQGGLFVGAAPRALRAAPACAIVLASYELLKLA